MLKDAFARVSSHPALARRRLTVYVRTGFGDSSRPAGPVNIAEQAAAAPAVLHHLGVARAKVVGHRSNVTGSQPPSKLPILERRDP